MAELKPLIAKVANGESLNREDARTAFDILMSGEATPSQIGGFLMALRVRGETVDEIVGAVSSMRARMLPVSAPPMPSISSEPAVTASAPIISRRWPRSSSPARACRSPSMATGR